MFKSLQSLLVASFFLVPQRKPGRVDLHCLPSTDWSVSRWKPRGETVTLNRHVIRMHRLQCGGIYSLSAHAHAPGTKHCTQRQDKPTLQHIFSCILYSPLHWGVNYNHLHLWGAGGGNPQLTAHSLTPNEHMLNGSCVSLWLHVYANALFIHALRLWPLTIGFD